MQDSVDTLEYCLHIPLGEKLDVTEVNGTFRVYYL